VKDGAPLLDAGSSFGSGTAIAISSDQRRILALLYKSAQNQRLILLLSIIFDGCDHSIFIHWTHLVSVHHSNVGWFFTQPLLLLLLGVVAQADTPSIAAGMGALGMECFSTWVFSFCSVNLW
jgi:hypothetical protein